MGRSCNVLALSLAVLAITVAHLSRVSRGNSEDCGGNSCVAFTYQDPDTTLPCGGATYFEAINLTSCESPCFLQVTTGRWIDGYCVADALFPNTSCSLHEWHELVPVRAFDADCDAVSGNQASCPCELVDLGVVDQVAVLECTTVPCP